MKPEILPALTDWLSPTDLQMLLLEVHRRRAARVSPARLLERYEDDRFTASSALDALEQTRLELLTLERLLSDAKGRLLVGGLGLGFLNVQVHPTP